MKKIIAKLKTLDKGTIIRTILQILVYINQLVALVVQMPFAKSPVYQWITFIVTVLITGITYWYNNDWSKFAQLSGSIFNMLKDGKITPEEIDQFVLAYKKKDIEGEK